MAVGRRADAEGAVDLLGVHFLAATQFGFAGNAGGP